MKLVRRVLSGFNNLPYRKKLLITHSSVLAIPIIVLGLYSFFQAREMLIDSKLNDINYYFSRASAELNQTVEDSEAILGEIRNDPTMNKILRYAVTTEQEDEELPATPKRCFPLIFTMSSPITRISEK